MNEMDVRKKMLEELMGQMDDRQMGQIRQPANGGVATPVAGERGNLSETDLTPGENDQEDELTRRLRQASLQQ